MMNTKPKWLQLFLLLFASMMFNNTYATPVKYARQQTEQVVQLAARAQSATPAFVQTANLKLRWCDVFVTPSIDFGQDIAVAFKQQLMDCLNVSQAPPVYMLTLPSSDDEYLLS